MERQQRQWSDSYSPADGQKTTARMVSRNSVAVALLFGNTTAAADVSAAIVISVN